MATGGTQLIMVVALVVVEVTKTEETLLVELAPVDREIMEVMALPITEAHLTHLLEVEVEAGPLQEKMLFQELVEEVDLALSHPLLELL